MEYEVLSPWGQVDKKSSFEGLQPRVEDLNGKTIGLYAHFKAQAPLILEEVAQRIKEKYPDAKFSHFQYPRDTAEIVNDVEYEPLFKKWLREVDTVICGYGDAGSCSLFLGYNSAAVESAGKPAVLIVSKSLVKAARTGAAVRNVPKMRIVSLPLNDLSGLHSFDNVVEEYIRPVITSAFIDEVIDALTRPLAEDEKLAEKKVEDSPRIVFKGDLEAVNRYFHKRWWSYGMPIIPPTEEAVHEMLAGTDLPPDHVVAEIPPMLGKATVEKIAINAVMAGCLPTYLPVLIAAVQGMMDPKIHLEGWTCSRASWGPFIVINGLIRRDINVHSGGQLMSSYHRANATIGHAIGLIVMNIGGVRPGVEDMSIMGHEGRFGMCIGENEEESPLEPHHVYSGLNKEDSAITLFWPTQRTQVGGKDVPSLLDAMCTFDIFGFDLGCAFVMTPAWAKILADEGWTKKRIISYLVEYARKPAGQFNVRWVKGNHHEPKGLELPLVPTHSMRRFFSSEHLLIVIAGDSGEPAVLAYGGGGDHGGPVTKKINLPAGWDRLVEKYKDIVPAEIQL
ncbi:MAG: hypothetical protein JXA46_18240 [Dehalococcoidales bacterium]|nr:hypothetical protein [Dehalococcoidales bacterium]